MRAACPRATQRRTICARHRHEDYSSQHTGVGTTHGEDEPRCTVPHTLLSCEPPDAPIITSPMPTARGHTVA